jgi:hypothetical protein
VGGNELTELPRNIFDNLTTLRGLYIDQNRLPASQLAWITQFCEERGIEVSKGEQKAPPLVLEPNVTEEEWEDYLRENKVSPECIICFEEVEQERAYKTACLPIGHFFHAECLKDWLETSKKTACPVCRQDVFVGGEAQRMSTGPFAYNRSKTSTVHMAKHVKKKHKKQRSVHVAHHAKKAKVAKTRVA